MLDTEDSGASPPDPVAAEVARASTLPLPELVELAADLAKVAHPAASTVWRLADKACVLGTDPAVRARIDEGLGAALTVSDNVEAQTRLGRAIALREALGDPVALAITRGRGALAAVIGGDPEAVAVLYDVATLIEAEATDEEKVIHLRRRAWGRLLTAYGEESHAAGVALLYQAEAAAAAIACHSEVLACRAMLLELAPPDEAAERVEEWAEHLADLHKHRWFWRLAAASLRLAQERISAGLGAADADEVLTLLAEAIQYGTEWGEVDVAAHASYLKARLLFDLERTDEARLAGFEAVMRAEQSDNEHLAALARLELGAAYSALGRYPETAELLRAALPAIGPEDEANLLRAGELLGEALLKIGDPDAAAPHLGSASEAAERAGDLSNAAHSALLAAEAAESAGQADQAAANFNRAAELFARAGATSDAAYASALAAQVTLDRLDDPEAAEAPARLATRYAAASGDTEAQEAAEGMLARVLEWVESP